MTNTSALKAPPGWCRMVKLKGPDWAAPLWHRRTGPRIKKSMVKLKGPDWHMAGPGCTEAPTCHEPCWAAHKEKQGETERARLGHSVVTKQKNS